MGLVLQDPSDPLSYSLLTHRHLPGRDPHANPRARHPRRPFAWSQSKTFKHHDHLVYGDVYGVAPRPHHITLFNALASRRRDPRLPDTDQYPYRNTTRKPRNWEVDEGVDIAHSPEVKLPGETIRRPPSLERQNAFRDARTAKRGVKRSFAQCALAADDEELYRLGVLYDDEYEREEGFSLEAIQRDMPWSLKVKHTKNRGRKEKRQEDFALDLALSFAALGDDEALAVFLMAPDENEVVEEVEEKGKREEQRLTVLYELESEAEDNDWAFLDGCLRKDGAEDGGDDTTDAGTDAWIMLGGDGS